MNNPAASAAAPKYTRAARLLKVGDRVRTAPSIPQDGQDTGRVMGIVERHRNGRPKLLLIGWDQGAATTCPSADLLLE